VEQVRVSKLRALDLPARVPPAGVFVELQELAFVAPLPLLV